MAIVVYKCDVCKRDIEIPRNPDGLDTLQNCIITHGCRGNMYHVNLLPDYQRGSMPPDVSGLDNWLQRKSLYNHDQGIERDVWRIVHGLGTYPSVQVLVNRPIEGDEDNQEEIQPTDTVLIDTNTIELYFDRPWSGIAQLITRQSDPNLLNPFTIATVTEEEFFQLSNSGTISVATRISTLGSTPNANLQVTYRTTQGSTPILTHTIDDQPSLDSAWNDFDQIIVNGTVYTIRSFNGITSEMTSGVIGNGSTLNFSAIDPSGTHEFQEILSGEVLILLANSPFSTFDKTVNSIIDVTASTSENTAFDFFYDSGEFYAKKSVVKSIYPHIRST